MANNKSSKQKDYQKEARKWKNQAIKTGRKNQAIRAHNDELRKQNIASQQTLDYYTQALRELHLCNKCKDAITQEEYLNIKNK